MNRVLIAAAVTLAATAAIAQENPRGGGLMRADANGDGVVTWAEAQAAAVKRFDRTDTDHDGTVSAAEAAASPMARMGRAPKTMTRADALARAKQRFDMADANHDGRLDAREIESAQAMMSMFRKN